jgi:ElaB/YqjD/DUF883 family membrane-anchored ribosome-binding protein
MSAERPGPDGVTTGSSTDAIRYDIERTRARLGATVEALGAELNPSHLAQRAKDGLREATIGRVQHMASNTKARISETGQSVVETIRENPFPAALAAAGIGWLLLERRDQRSTREPRRYVDGAGVATDSPYSSQEHHGSKLDDMTSDVAERASDIKDKAQDVAHRVTEKAREAGQRVSETADATARKLRNRTRETRQSVEDQYRENPLALGGIALALGLAIGMSAPRTRREVEMLGDKRDRLMEKAREQVAETKEKVEGVVEKVLPEVQTAVREAAREEGLIR